MNKNSRSKKIIKILLYTVMSVLFAATALLGAWLWYIPHTWIKIVKNDFLLRNQLRFRAGDIRPGNFNGLYMQNVELGQSNAPLFKAPHGTLTLELLPNESWHQFGFKQLELTDTLLQLNNLNGQLVLNGLPLDKFISELINLPLSPDGKFIPLRIVGTLAIGNQRPASQIDLQIKYFPDSKLLQASANWRSLNSTPHSGSWDAQVDLSAGTVTGIIKGDIPIHFFQELQLRSDVPPQLLGLLPQAAIHGSMQFSASLPDWQITDSSFDGKVSAAELRWYDHKFQQLDPFALSIRQNQRGTCWQIPLLSWQKPMPFAVKNISLNFQKNQPAAEFHGQCDLLQSAVNSFCTNLQLPPVMLTTRNDTINGRWNLHNNRWQLSGSAASSAAPGDIQVAGQSQTSLQLSPQTFSFQASGTGGRGRISQSLEFSKLYMQHHGNKIRADRGSFFITLEIGKHSVTVTDSLEFNFGNFAAETRLGQWSFPGLAGQINLRKLPDHQQELYLIARARGSHLLLPWGTFNSGAWQLTANLEQDLQQQRWKLSGIDLTVPELKTSYGKQIWEARQVTLRGNGEMLNKKLQKADLQLNSEQIRTSVMNLAQIALKVKYDVKKTADKSLQTNLTCRQAEFATPWHGIKNALNSQLILNGTSWKDYSQNLDLKAEKLTFAHRGFAGHVSQLRWQQFRQNPREWDYQIKFDSLQAALPHNNLGSGSFSKGNLTMKTVTAQDGKRLDQLNLIGDLSQPAWKCGELQTGSENMQCSIMLNRSNMPQIQIQTTCAHTNILSKYFSAMTPELTCSLTGDSLRKITGKLNFATGSITGSDGSLELKNARFELPLLLTDQPAEEPTTGRLTADKLLWNRQEEGKLTARLKHAFVIEAAAGNIKQHTLNFDGVLNSQKFANAPVKITAHWQLSPAEPQMKYSLEMPESRLQEPINLNKYFALPLPLNILKGNLGFQAQISEQANTPQQAQIKFNAIQSDWQVGNLTAENLAAALSLTCNNGQVIMTPHDIVAGRICWRDFEWKNNALKLSVSPGWQLLVSGWEGSMLDGKIQLTSPVTFNAANTTGESIDMQFDVQNLPAGEFFRLLKMDYITSDMLISGKLHPYLENGKLFFKSAILSGSTPAGRILKITPQSPEAIRIPNQQHRGFVLAVLKAMKCYRTLFEFSTSNVESSLNIKAEGVPAQPVPFVYQGNINGTPFRPAEPGEQGFDGELEMNVKLKIHPAEPGI